MILSHTHEFVFLCNGKTGTTSVEAALSEYQEGEEFEVGIPGLYENKHVPPAALRGLLGPEIWEEYFVFCFVRNPWDWFVSQFFWNQDPDPISKRKLVWKPIETLKEYREKEKKRRYLRELETFSPAEVQETYDRLKKYRAVYQADSLFQYHYAYTPGGEKLVDFVGRFEQFERDFRQAMQHIGIDAQLPHQNATSHRSYQTYYTPETKELVRTLYHLDVNTFEYSF